MQNKINRYFKFKTFNTAYRFLMPYSGFYLFVIVLLFMSISCDAQTRISGTVLDSITKNPIAYCTIRIKNQDPKLGTATQTDPDGKFSIPVVKPGNYSLEITALSYLQYQRSLKLPDSGVLVMGNILMNKDAKNLGDVTIVAKQNLIERRADKIIMNVGNSVLTNGSTANELLQQIPGLSAGDDGQIRLNGRAGVSVMIDNKVSPLSASELSSLLQNMPSGSISRIEIITNPSSKYDAVGAGGIINIITKKNTQAGVNGSASAGYNQGIYPNLLGSFMLNVKKGRFNVFGSYSYNKMKRSVNFKIDRFIDASVPLNFQQEMKFKPRFDNQVAKVGVDYDINNSSAMGFTFDLNIFERNRTIDDVTLISDRNFRIDSVYSTQTSNLKKLTNTAYNFYYNHKFKETGHNIEFNYTFSQFDNFDDRISNNFYYYPDGRELKMPNSIRNNVPFLVNNNVARIDYTVPFNKTTKLEAGVKGGWIRQENDLIYDSIINGAIVNVPAKNSSFSYSENLLAAYLNLSKKIDGYNLHAGLRLEGTSSDANFFTSGLRIKNDYTNLFPSVSADKKFNAHDLRISASRRIGRPSYQDLDPTLIYFNQYYYLQGNPSLKPEYTNVYSFSDTFKENYSLSVSYSRTSNPIVSIQEIQEKTNINIFAVTNLDVLSNVSVALDIPVTVTNWWNMNNNAYGYFNQTKAADYMGKSYDRHLFGFGFSTNHTFTLKNNYKLECQFKYDAPQLIGLNRLEEIYYLNLGVQKLLMNKKANVKLSVYDLLNSMKYNYQYDYFNVHSTERRSLDYRQLRLSFTYNFGGKSLSNRKSSEKDNGNERLKIQ
ncbi:outer membrane beta-barrel protein [Pedobacter mendelii]|uniref:outer membrane beta-barrel protein n=1 Tax=Pedobacter mendelii TaxID=1908240 RepID=UPI003621EC72